MAVGYWEADRHLNLGDNLCGYPMKASEAMDNPSMKVVAKPTTVTVVEADWDDPPVEYNQVVLKLRGGPEYHMTPQDAQVLGAWLNRAGGGSA